MPTGRDQTIDELRQDMENRKRVTLSEGRMLLSRLEDAAMEIARLQESLERAEQNHSNNSHIPADEQQIPESLGGLLAQAREIAAASERASLSNAVYKWCNDWMYTRSSLIELLNLEQKIRDDIERLEHEAEAMTRHLSALIEKPHE